MKGQSGLNEGMKVVKAKNPSKAVTAIVAIAATHELSVPKRMSRPKRKRMSERRRRTGSKLRTAGTCHGTIPLSYRKQWMRALCSGSGEVGLMKWFNHCRITMPMEADARLRMPKPAKPQSKILTPPLPALFPSWGMAAVSTCLQNERKGRDLGSIARDVDSAE